MSGEKIIQGLEEFSKALEDREDITKRFRCHKVVLCECGKPQASNEATKKYCGCCDDCMPF